MTRLMDIKDLRHKATSPTSQAIVLLVQVTTQVNTYADSENVIIG